MTVKYDGQSTLQEIEDETGLSKSAISLFRKRARNSIHLLGEDNPTFEKVVFYDKE